MAQADVLILGFVAGFTIFLGLPVARLDNASGRLRAALNYLAIGILLFLFVEVAEHAWQGVELATEEATLGYAGWDLAARYAVVFAGGLLVGLLSLVWFETRFVFRGKDPARVLRNGDVPPDAGPQRLALMIALGIGLHNFSEGLAIGASAATGALSLAFALGVGFALHNATEGFGIAAPLAGSKPSWGFLGLAGLIGGGPTFVGTLVGSAFSDALVSTLFLSLAAGALIYVVRQLFLAGRKESADPANAMVVMGAVAIGVLIGFGTELAIELAGA